MIKYTLLYVILITLSTRIYTQGSTTLESNKFDRIQLAASEEISNFKITLNEGETKGSIILLPSIKDVSFDYICPEEPSIDGKKGFKVDVDAGKEKREILFRVKATYTTVTTGIYFDIVFRTASEVSELDAIKEATASVEKTEGESHLLLSPVDKYVTFQIKNISGIKSIKYTNLTDGTVTSEDLKNGYAELKFEANKTPDVITIVKAENNEVKFKYQLESKLSFTEVKSLDNVKISSFLNPNALIQIQIQLAPQKFGFVLNSSVGTSIYGRATTEANKGVFPETKEDFKIEKKHLFTLDSTNAIAQVVIQLANFAENEINISFQEDVTVVNATDINPIYTKEITINTSTQSIFKLVGSEKFAFYNNKLYVYVPNSANLEAEIFISNNVEFFEKPADTYFSQKIEGSGLVSFKLQDKTFNFDVSTSFYVYIKVTAGTGKINPEFFFSAEQYIYDNFSNYNLNLAPKAKAYILLKSVPEKNQVSIFADGADLYERSAVEFVSSLYTHFTEKGFDKQNNLDYGPPKALASFYVENPSDEFISVKLYTTFEYTQTETFNLGEKRIIAIESDSLKVPLLKTAKYESVSVILLTKTDKIVKIGELELEFNAPKNYVVAAESVELAFTVAAKPSPTPPNADAKIRLLISSASTLVATELKEGNNSLTEASKSFYFTFQVKPKNAHLFSSISTSNVISSSSLYIYEENTVEKINLSNVTSTYSSTGYNLALYSPKFNFSEDKVYFATLHLVAASEQIEINYSKSSIKILSSLYDEYTEGLYAVKSENNVDALALNTLNKSDTKATINSRDSEVKSITSKATTFIIDSKPLNNYLFKIEGENAKVILSPKFFKKIEGKNYEIDASSKAIESIETSQDKFKISWKTKLFDSDVIYTLYKFEKVEPYTNQTLESIILNWEDFTKKNKIAQAVDVVKVENIEINKEAIFDIYLVAQDITTSKLYLYKNNDLINIHEIDVNEIQEYEVAEKYSKNSVTKNKLDEKTNYIFNFSFANNDFSEESTINVYIFEAAEKGTPTKINFEKGYYSFTTTTSSQYEVELIIIPKDTTKKTKIGFFITNNNGNYQNKLKVSPNQIITYSTETNINSKITFIDNNNTPCNRVIYSLAASADNTSVKIVSNAGETNEYTANKETKDINYSTLNELIPEFTLSATVPEASTLRLSFSLKSFATIFSSTFDSKLSNNRDIIRAYYEINTTTDSKKKGFILISNSDLNVSKILFSESIPMTIASYDGENQGVKFEKGFTFDLSDHKYLLVEAHRVAGSTAELSLESSLLQVGFTGDDAVTEIKCSTTRPHIYEISDPKLIVDTLYAYSPFESKIKVQLSINTPSYIFNNSKVDYITSSSGSIVPLKLDESLLLETIEKLYISVFSTDIADNTQKIQLFFGNNKSVNLGYLLINDTTNSEIGYSLGANETKTVIIKLAKDLDTEKTFGLSANGGALVASKIIESIGNIKEDFVKDLKAESAFTTVTYKNNFLIVLIKGIQTPTKGNLFLTEYTILTENKSDATYKTADNKPQFYQINGSAEKQITLTVTLPIEEVKPFKLFINSRKGNAKFKFAEEEEKDIVSHKVLSQLFTPAEPAKETKFTITASEDLFISMFTLFSEPDILIVENDEKKLSFNEVSNSFVYVLKKLSGPEDNIKTKRIIFNSTDSVFTSLSYSVMQDTKVADNNKIYDTKSNYENHVSNISKSNSLSFVRSSDYDQLVIVRFTLNKISTSSDLTDDNKPTAIVITEVDSSATPAQYPDLSKKIKFTNSIIQTIRVDAGTQPTVITRYYMDYNNKVECKYRINQKSYNNLTDGNQIIKVADEGAIFTITLVCKLNAELLFTVTPVPASYTENNIIFNALVRATRADLNNNKIEFSVQPNESLFKNIVEAKVQYYIYAYDQKTQTTDRVDSILQLLNQTDRKAESVPKKLEYDSKTGKKDVIIFGEDKVSGQIFRYQTYVLDTDLGGNDDNKGGLSWVIILIIVLGSILVLVGLAFLIRHFMCKKHEDTDVALLEP